MGKIAKYLDNYPNQNTVHGYRASIYSFFDNVYGSQRNGKMVTPQGKELYEALADRYFTEVRNYLQYQKEQAQKENLVERNICEVRNYPEDMAAFAVSMNARPPQAARGVFGNVVEFFSHYDLELTKKDAKFIKNKLPKGSTARTVEKDLDTETIRTIIQHVDVKGRALILTLASSGMRINEALSLTLEDIDLKKKPAEIQIRGENTKTGDTRLSFISTEAATAVNEWLKVRTAYIESSVNRNNGLVKKGMAKRRARHDQRVFPFSDNVSSVIWDNAIIKAELMSRDRGTNRKQLHYHQLRKFFISQLSLVISKEIPEMLAGHSGYLTGEYRRYTKKQLAEQYLKGERMVTIQGDADVGQLREDLDTTVKTLSETRNGQEKTSSALSTVVIENAELKSKLETMSEQLVSMQHAAAGQNSEISELREQTSAISKLVEKLMSEDVKTQKDKGVEHGRIVAASLLKSPRKK